MPIETITVVAPVVVHPVAALVEVLAVVAVGVVEIKKNSKHNKNIYNSRTWH